MFTWLYLLNGKLLCYSCCINVKLIHYHLEYNFKTYSSYLHVLLSTGRWRSKILLKKSRVERQTYTKSFVSLHQELLIMIAELSLWFSSMADWHSGHVVDPWRPLHRPGKSLSCHKKLSSIFTQLLPSTMSCVCFEHPLSIPLAGTRKFCTLSKVHSCVSYDSWNSNDCPFK
jgi:hypothetical protein